MEDLTGDQVDRVNASLLSNIEVGEFMQDLIYYEVPFLGVKAVDDVPLPYMKKSKYWLIVINLDKHYEKGSHFIVLSRKPNDTLYFFDSLALSVLPKALLQYISILEKEIKTRAWQLRDPIQAIDSTACGYFCLHFMLIWHFCDATYADLDFIYGKLSRRTKLKDNDVEVYQKIKVLMALYVMEKFKQIENYNLESLPVWPKLSCNHPQSHSKLSDKFKQLRKK